VSAIATAVILGEAFQAAPTNWLRGYRRIDNRVRDRMRIAASTAMTALEAIDDQKRPPTWYGAQVAVLEMRRVSCGVDPRGGTERDQMVTAMGNVAREMSRTLSHLDTVIPN